jgi:hypothetical protein
MAPGMCKHPGWWEHAIAPQKTRLFYSKETAMLRYILTASVVVFLSAALAGAAFDKDIGFDAVNTTYDHTTSQLSFTQEGIVMVVEEPDGTQTSVDDVDFSLTISLFADASSGTGQAKGTFGSVANPGVMTIKDSADVILLQADIPFLKAEENVFIAPDYLITYSGNFNITQGSWLTDYSATNGKIDALSWILELPPVQGGHFDDFDLHSYEGETMLNLRIPEPATMSLMLGGAAVALARRRKHR